MMTVFRRQVASAIFCSAVATAMLGSPHANAQTSAPSTRAQREAAEHDKRAFSAIKRGDAETARLEFLRSHAVVPSAKTLWNLLLAEMDSNHPLDALKHLRVYLGDPLADPKKKEKGRELLGELKSQVGQLRLAAQEDVSVTVDGITVTSEQRKEGVDVAPGKHVVEAILATGPQRKVVEAIAGKETVVSFDAPASESQAIVAPPVAPSPPALKETSSPPPPERSRASASPPVATWILGGVAVAALGTGVAFSLSAQSKKDEIGDNPNACANPNSSECARVQDLDDAGRRNSTIGWIAYGTAGAALVTGGLLWIFAPKSRSTTGRADVVPMGGPGVAGIRLQTTF